MNELQNIFTQIRDCLRKHPRLMVLDWAIILVFTKISLVDFCSILPINKSLIALGSLGLAYCLLIYSMIFERTKVCWDGIGVLIVTVLIFAVTIHFHPEYHSVMFVNEDWNIWSTVFNLCSMPFIYYFFRLQKNLRNLEYDLLLIAYIRLMGCTVRLLQVTSSDEEYNMTLGYTISFSAIIFMYYYFKNSKNIHYLFFSVFGMLIALIKGSRGPILGYVCFIALYMVLVQRKITKTKLFVLIAGIGGALLYQSNTVMRAIYNLLKTHGLESRTLEKIIVGDIADSSGRDKIYENIINALMKQNPFIPYGAYGDRYITHEKFYSHNVILEIMITFGVVLGTLLIILLVYYLVKIFVIYRNYQSFGMLIALVSYAICHLMFSTSFWYEQVFGAMLAVMVTMLEPKKNNLFGNRVGKVTISISEDDMYKLEEMDILPKELTKEVL